MTELFKYYQKRREGMPKVKGTLYWAGVMSTIIANLMSASVSQVSEYIVALDSCRKEYDKEILKLVESKNT